MNIEWKEIKCEVVFNWWIFQILKCDTTYIDTVAGTNLRRSNPVYWYNLKISKLKRT